MRSYRKAHGQCERIPTCYGEALQWLSCAVDPALGAARTSLCLPFRAHWEMEGDVGRGEVVLARCVVFVGRLCYHTLAGLVRGTRTPIPTFMQLKPVSLSCTFKRLQDLIAVKTGDFTSFQVSLQPLVHQFAFFLHTWWTVGTPQVEAFFRAAGFHRREVKGLGAGEVQADAWV